MCIWIAISTENTLVSDDLGLNMVQFCQKYGYTLYNETVITDDKYILTMHRIPCSQFEENCKRGRPPVLIMHGLTGNALDFLAAKNQSLAFQLADKGFDVWLGNQRGNTYSRKHVTLDPDKDSMFWNFSFHEIGISDIPAMIDHIIAKTNFSKITYVGMSQGATVFFVMTSTRPEYNDKILLANLIAPVTTLFNTRNVLFGALAAMNFIVEPALDSIGPIELFGYASSISSVFRKMCESEFSLFNYLCTEWVIKDLMGSSEELNYNLLPFYISLSPAGASSKQLMHFVQNKLSGNFCQYDYYEKNQAYYGQSTPLLYDLSKITAPISIYFSKGDVFLNTTFFFKDISPIQNIVLMYEVPCEHFNHLEFIFAKDVNQLLNNKLIQTIELFNNNN